MHRTSGSQACKDIYAGSRLLPHFCNSVDQGIGRRISAPVAIVRAATYISNPTLKTTKPATSCWIWITAIPTLWKTCAPMGMSPVSCSRPAPATCKPGFGSVAHPSNPLIADKWIAKELLQRGISAADVAALLRGGYPGFPRRHADPEDYLHRTLTRALRELHGQTFPAPRAPCV